MSLVLLLFITIVMLLYQLMQCNTNTIIQSTSIDDEHIPPLGGMCEEESTTTRTILLMTTPTATTTASAPTAFYYVLQAQPSNIASCQPISLSHPHSTTFFWRTDRREGAVVVVMEVIPINSWSHCWWSGSDTTIFISIVVLRRVYSPSSWLFNRV